MIVYYRKPSTLLMKADGPAQTPAQPVHSTLLTGGRALPTASASWWTRAPQTTFTAEATRNADALRTDRGLKGQRADARAARAAWLNRR
jgi:hypothetical protein